MTRARDVALIRKLCGLGLPPQTLAQSLVPALRNLIPSHSGGVFWVDDKGEITNLFAERLLPPDVMADYYERHHRRANEGFGIAFKRRAEAPDPIATRSFSRAEQESSYFKEVMRLLDAYHVLYGILRDGAHPYAQLSLYRGRLDAPFDKRDAETLRSVLRYVSAGLAHNHASAGTNAASTILDESLGIVGHDGTLVSAPEPWLKTLRLAVLAEVSPRNASHEAEAVHAFLRGICERLDNDRAQHARIDHQNAWGRFAIHAFRLADTRGRRATQLGVLIRREEPRMLALLRGLGDSDLSPQQREVALLLAQGLSNREIAQTLRLSLNTASYHVKQVFARLGVNDRAEVARHILESAPAPFA